MTTISSLPLSLPLPRHYPCCCCYLRCCAADATAVSCANDAIIKGDNDDEGSAYNHRRRCPFKMSAKAASHLHTHLNGNLSQISSPPTHPSAAVHRQRPNIDKTKVSMKNAYEQTKHSIHGKQMSCLCGVKRHRTRQTQIALTDASQRHPPIPHHDNIGTHPPQTKHAGNNETHR